jgi:arabinose-5-phosphate isomerase
MHSVIPSCADFGAAVVRQEADALSLLAESLGSDFSAAISLIIGSTGRIIVAGVGKSGHVARKTAATFSATGSSAYFMHAGEASHGDLGMIQPGDILIAFSNSGETAELRPVVRYAKQLGVPIIAIASVAKSTLAKAADVALVLPPVPEACPEQVAPTTSSTMMMALGDALALSVMRERGVSRADLASWHPGGRIGWRMMPVDDLIRPDDDIPLITPDTGMRDVVIEMSSCGKGIAGIVDREGALIGVITDGDLRRSFDRMLIATAGEIMSRTPITVPSGTLIGDVVALMHDRKITVLFVLSNDGRQRPIGLVHIHDLDFGA